MIPNAIAPRGPTADPAMKAAIMKRRQGLTAMPTEMPNPDEQAPGMNAVPDQDESKTLGLAPESSITEAPEKPLDAPMGMGLDQETSGLLGRNKIIGRMTQRGY